MTSGNEEDDDTNIMSSRTVKYVFLTGQGAPGEAVGLNSNPGYVGTDCPETEIRV